MDKSTLIQAIARTRSDIAESVQEMKPISTGKFNTSFFMATHEAEYVLRVAPDPDDAFVFYERHMMKQEPQLHRILRERTDVPVARIDMFDESREVIPRDFLLMQRLPGEPVSGAVRSDPDRVLYQVGKALAQVHAITDTRYGYLGAHRPMQPQSTWVAAFDIMWNKMIDDIVACGYYSSAQADALRSLFARHRHLFDRTVASRLLHMDVWAQNILVDHTGSLSGLLDWDRALWGDPEIEYAVLDYCGISTPAFWEGYGATRDESEEARIRTFFYLLYEIQKYIVIRGARNRRPDAARSYREQVFRMVTRSFDVPGLT